MFIRGCRCFLIISSLLWFTSVLHAQTTNGEKPTLNLSINGGSAELRLGDGPSFHASHNDIINPVIITIPDSPQLIALWDEVDDSDNIIPFYGISYDGVEVVQARRTSYDLSFRIAQFDPIYSTPDISAKLRSKPEHSLYIVQFVTHPISAYRKGLKNLGVTIYNYFPQHAYIVKMNSQIVNLVRALPFVRWVGEFHPAYRAEEKIIEELRSGVSEEPQRKYSIVTLAQDEIMMNNIVTRIYALGGIVHYSSPMGKTTGVYVNAGSAGKHCKHGRGVVHRHCG